MTDIKRAAAGEQPTEDKRQIRGYGYVYSVEVSQKKKRKSVRLVPIGMGFVLKKEKDVWIW